jgi:site-specific DNA recombinase
MMHVALYARVSTARQAQAQTIEQQLERLRAYVQQQGWTLEERHIYRDDGYSGASLNRPGLDQLRDCATLAELDRVVITAPDRLARNYVHQVLVMEELERHGCQVEFLDRPMSQDPHDRLLLQIRGAVAEYERTLIADRMRRGRLAKLRAGALLPWTKPLFGYQVDPQRPRDPAGMHPEPFEAVVVQQIFAWYLEQGATLYRVAKRLTEAGIATPSGQPRWHVASVRGILKNPAYTGTAAANRTQQVPARQRKSALSPVGSGSSRTPRPPDDWIPIPVPALVTQEVFDRVQEKLAHNQQGARRNNTHYEYLLRSLVSCQACQLSTTARTTPQGYDYYVCRGRTDALRAAQGQRCRARYVPARQLDELVWQDLCAVLTNPELMATALQRARSGEWLSQELQARQASVRQALQQIERQDQRLLEAYLAAVLELAEFERKRQELARRRESLIGQQRQLEAVAHQQIALGAVADGLEAFCTTVRQGLAHASFTERRALVELLIDRVIVLDGEVEIRYVIPTSPEGPHSRFCHLRLDYLDLPAPSVGQHDLPGILCRLDRLVRQEIPWLPPTTRAGDHQPDGGRILGMVKADRQHSHLAQFVVMGIPQVTLLPGPLPAHHLPGGTRPAGGVPQVIALGPAQHKAHPRDEQQPQPPTPGVAAVEDVQHKAAPGEDTLPQQHLAHGAGLRRRQARGVPVGPPAHRCHSGRAGHADDEEREPAHPRHEDRPAGGRAVEARPNAQEASGFAGTHRAQAFRGPAFRLLQGALVPEEDRLLSRRLQLLDARLCLLPEKAGEEYRLPLGRTQQVGEPFRAGGCLVGTQQIRPELA